MKNIKYLLITGLALSLSVVELFAQSAQEKIESARIALITDRLSLTPEEAQKFWPLYNEYTNERQQLKQEYMEARKQYREGEMTEAESKELLNLGLKLKERDAQLERKYAEKLNQVISTRQLLALRKAEDDFKKMLLERLQERREKQERFQNRQERKFRDN
ncbi:hypothetical protein C9994_00430 [Marivirga lumbricoides]|uniref:Sensor of ECF-type sigma factor n=1 Tax=Marivirga lumbricoides TaxID=1046115 RepID=A0A2T4DVR3_9BACT|nr:hypothetical protein C9994_00430 [Marivirga lumbricoides]